MTTLATLTVDLMANSANFRNEMRAANRSSRGWADGVRKSARIAGAAITAASVAAAGALTATYIQQSKAIDQQAKFADRIGVSTEALSGLQHAAELTGVSSDQLNMGLQRMTRRVAEAAQGTGEAVGALETLGISAKELNELSPDQQFKRIAEAMEGVEGRSEKVRLAFKLFDSEGVGLVNTLDMGADGLSSMEKEAEMLGISLSRVDAAKIEQANDQMYRVGQLSRGVGMQITAELAPIVEGLANEWLRSAQEAGGAGSVISEVVNYGVEAVGFLANTVRGVSVAWEVVQAASASAVKYALEGIVALDRGITDFINWLPGMEAEYNQQLAIMSRAFGMMAEDAWQEAHDLAIKPLPADGIKQWVKDIQSSATATADATAKNRIMASSYQEIADNAITAGEVVKKSGKESGSAFDQYISNASDASTQIERSAVSWTESFSNSLAGMVQKGKLSFSSLADSIITDLLRISIQSNIVAPLATAFGFGTPAAAPSITTPAPRALGGSVNAGTTYLVGERGPELFTAGTPGNITNNENMGGSNVVVNVYNEHGGQVERRERTGANGMKNIDIFITKQVRQTIIDDISRGQGIAGVFEGNYGLSRKAGR